MTQTLLRILVLLIICLNCYGQKNQTVTVNSRPIIDNLLEQRIQKVIDPKASVALKNDLINVLSIGIYINQTPYTFHYGELTKNKGDKPKDNTIYEIASVTKTFTGTLAAKAVAMGKLDLEDDIRKYLPQPYPNLAYQGKAIKVKHLLTHTSGLPGGLLGFKEVRTDINEIEFNHQYLNFENKQTKAQFFQELAQLKMTSEPGSRFNYSNPGSNLMGYILERIFNRPFQQLILDEIIAKADMDDTHFHTPKNKQQRLANGYLLNMPAPETNLAKVLWGAEGALKSTLVDLLKYIRYQLNNDDIVKESHKKLYEIDKDYWIGYFWWIISNQNYDLHYRHDGGITKAKNILAIYPEKSIGISIITNQSSFKINQILDDLSHDIYRELSNL